MKMFAFELKKGVQYPGIPSLLLVWALVGILAYTRHDLLANGTARAPFSWADLLGWLTCFCPWAFLGPLVFSLERRFPLGASRWARNTVVLLLVGMGFSYVAFLLAKLLSRAVAYFFHLPPDNSAPFWNVPAGEAFLQFLFFAATLGAAYLIRNLIRLQSEERAKAQLLLERSQLEASLGQAKLDVLRMRLNPHFLFNTLQNISVLAQENPRLASQMLTRLGDLLRSALRSESQPETTLQAEIALTECYVAVEQMRFGDGLQVSIELAPGTTDALVPALVLQPLVENAIQHGIGSVGQKGVIRICSELHARQLILTVNDNGQGVAAQSIEELRLGVGLGSTRERLTRMYGTAGALTLQGLPEGGTQARISLPYHMVPAEMVPSYEQATTPDRR